jgi:type IV pilus assembly protein PilA
LLDAESNAFTIPAHVADSEQSKNRRTRNIPGEDMQRQKGFSLIELLIVVAIILIIAAIAIPNLLRARMAANESSAVASVRTVTTGEITYQSTYPTVGYAPALVNLGGPLGAACVPSSTTGCLIDSVLANNGNPANSGKSGYMFTTGAGAQAGGVNIGYTVLASPITINQTGIRAFCAEEDAVIRVDPVGKCSNSEAGILTFNPLNQ